MTLSAYRRPGSAGLTVGGILFYADSYHTPDQAHQRWLTGVFLDIGPWKRDPYRSWFVEIVVLGFSIGACL